MWQKGILGKKKNHGQKHSSVSMQMYFRKDDWTDFIRASVLRVPKKNDGDGGSQGLNS